jgi:hypothetical protein
VSISATLLVTSAIFLLISPIAYAISILRGESRPHRLTRLALMAALLLSFFSALGAHANLGTLVVTGIAALHGVVIFGLSMWRGMGGRSLFDWLCFGLAIIGLIGWQISGNALVGIWFAIFADAMAYVPAILKTWRHPHTEGHWFYTLSVIGTFLGLIAYPFSPASVFQVYLIVSALAMIFSIYHDRILRRTYSTETADH